MVVLALAAGPASAQFGGLGAKKAKDGADPEALVASFVESYSQTLEAEAKFAEAFGLQDAATLLKAELQSLSSGPLDLDALQKTRETLQPAINEKMQATPELDAESRAMFTEGLAHYGKALVGAKVAADMAPGVANSISSNPLSLNASARTGLAVAKEVPGYLNSLRENTMMVFEYAKRNNIEPPAEATSLLASL
jgi:hypothetical protein